MVILNRDLVGLEIKVVSIQKSWSFSDVSAQCECYPKHYIYYCAVVYSGMEPTDDDADHHHHHHEAICNFEHECLMKFQGYCFRHKNFDTDLNCVHI